MNTESWIRTYTGGKVYFFEPEKSEIEFEDISHSLSLLCRFNGATKEFYCPVPETRVLTSSLIWKQIGDTKPGEVLIGFDEKPPLGNRLRRKLRPSKILSYSEAKVPCLRIILSNGQELISSYDHAWLTTTRVSQNQHWETSLEIYNRFKLGRKTHLLKYLNTWDVLKTNDSGYIEGIYDGEGYVSFSNGRTLQVGFAQNAGIVLDKTVDILRKMSFSTLPLKNSDANNVWNFSIKGGWSEQLRFLGQIRPVRLLNKFSKEFEREGYIREFPSIEMNEVEFVECCGNRDVVGLETSSKTYFAEGYGSHNCVAQHSCIVAAQVYEETGDKDLAYCGLMHDAHEAFVSDIPSPFKKQFPEFVEAEKRFEIWLSARFNYTPFLEIVKKHDIKALATEMRDLMNVPDYSSLSESPYEEKIYPLPPMSAKEMFEDVYNKYKP